MAEILDTIDPKGELADQLEAARNNFLALNKQSLKAGAYSLIESTVAVAQNVSSTSYVDLTEFKGAFNSSGGLVSFSFCIGVSVTALNCWLSLLLDDTNVIAQAIVGCAPSALTVTVPLNKVMTLNEGKHTFKVQAKVDAGTAVIGAFTDVKSSITITEFLRG